MHDMANIGILIDGDLLALVCHWLCQSKDTSFVFFCVTYITHMHVLDITMSILVLQKIPNV